MAKTKAKGHTVKAGAAEVHGLANTPQETAMTPIPLKDGAISALAYEFWIQRGCPSGTPDEDWYRAEEELKNRKTLTTMVHGRE